MDEHELTCPFCHARGQARKNRNGRWYYRCENCGPVNVHGQAFQAWVAAQAPASGTGEGEGDDKPRRGVRDKLRDALRDDES